MTRYEDDRTARTDVVDRPATTTGRRDTVAEKEYEREDRHDRRTHGALGLDRERQRDAYGGFNVGAAFFGWLVAIGLAALLTALLSAAGAAIGLTEIDDGDAETISLVGAILFVVVLAVSYYAGGYVAGRMSRFDGDRQGLGVWLMGITVTIALAILGVIAGTEYNVLGSLDLPRIPIDEGDLTTGAVITLIAVLVLTALAAIGGGKAGERYHRKVDAVGLHRD